MHVPLTLLSLGEKFRKGFKKNDVPPKRPPDLVPLPLICRSTDFSSLCQRSHLSNNEEEIYVKFFYIHI